MKGIEDRICYVWELFHIGSYMKAIFAAFETHMTRFGELLMTGVQLPPPTPGRGASQAGPPKNEIPRNFSVRIISYAAGVAVSSACVVHSMHCANDSSD